MAAALLLHTAPNSFIVESLVCMQQQPGSKAGEVLKTCWGLAAAQLACVSGCLDISNDLTPALAASSMLTLNERSLPVLASVRLTVVAPAAGREAATMRSAVIGRFSAAT